MTRLGSSEPPVVGVFSGAFHVFLVEESGRIGSSLRALAKGTIQQTIQAPPHPRIYIDM